MLALLKDVRRRNRQPEIMDDPGLDQALYLQSLSALERINLVSRSAGILWPDILSLASRSGRALRVLDLATGAGDIPIHLWERSRRHGLKLEFAGCDVNPAAISHAQERAARAGADVRFFQCNVFEGDLRNDFDVLTTTLFLHHLDEAPAIYLLGAMAKAARQAVLINDLERSPLGYWLAWLGTRLLSFSHVAHVDGPRSVEGAYTVAEALQLAERAGLHGARVRRRWPCRYLLSWSKR